MADESSLSPIQNDTLHFTKTDGLTVDFNIAKSAMSYDSIDNKPKLTTAVLRVHNLPLGACPSSVAQVVVDGVDPNIKIVRCGPEYFRDCPTISSGIVRIKIQYPTSLDAKIRAHIIGKRTICRRQLIVSIAGDKPKCTLCDQEGHVRKNCPKLDVVCGRCRRRGHTTSECSDAKRLGGGADIQDNNLIEEEEE